MADRPCTRYMVTGSRTWERSRERWHSTAFLIAGGLLLVFAVSDGLSAFTSMEPPGWVTIGFIAAGLIAGHVGLLGLYPQLADHVPRQALAGAIVVTIAAIGTLGLFVAVIVNTVQPAIGLPVVPFYLVMILGTILAFLLFSVASLRTHIPSRTVGLILLGPPTVFILMIAMVSTAPDWLTFLIRGLQAGAYAAVGVVLWIDSIPTDRPDPAPEPTTK